MVVFVEQFLRMGFLKIVVVDFVGWDVGGDGQYWDMVVMIVK